MSGGAVGRAVRRARLDAALTQRELADRAGLSVGALRDLEQGRSAHPKPATVAALASALGLPSAAALRVDAAPVAESAPVRAAVVVRVLGGVAIGGPAGWRAVEGRGQSLTLGLLALHAGDDVTHHALGDVLWPDELPDSAAELLRSYVARLRRRLTPVGVDIESGTGRYRLVVDPDACDVSRFRADLRAAEVTADPQQETDLLRDALGLWPAARPADLPELREHPTAVALERERVRATARLATTAVAAGHPDHAVEPVLVLAERDPLDESLAAAAVTVLAAAGRMADAQAVHARTRRALAEDLGLDPGPELVEAFRKALQRGGPTGPGRPTGRAVPTPSPAPTEPAAPVPDPRPGSVVPAQLPRTLRALHGRAEELAEAVEALSSGPGAAPAVVVVSGMGGLGKTTLAVAVAHAVADRYPDGQVFVDLDGVGEPLQPAAVLEHFLVSWGHERSSLPGDLEGLVAAFRTDTASARCLVVLDNAADAEQVEALLPAGPGCGVLVTSRRSLTDLDDALHVRLAELNPTESFEMLAAGVGHARVTAEPDAAVKIVALCGGLPLALRMVVARLRTNPSWRVADVADLLGDEHVRLDALRSGSRAVRASFELSHRGLTPDAARLFRVAAVVPGSTFTAAAAAAAFATADDEPAVRTALDDLVDRGMLGAAAGGRYRFHDLLRAYADEHGRRHTADTGHARGAVLHWFERTARGATRTVLPHRIGAEPDPVPPSSPDLHDPRVQAAATWLDTEVETLAAAVTVAAVDHPDLAWRLADAASGAFRRATTSQEFEQAARAGLAAAETVGDALGTALMCELLARAHVARFDHLAAVGWFARAGDLAVTSGCTALEVSVRENWGISLLVLGRHHAATQQFEIALHLARTAGLRYWEAACRNDLGNVAILGGRVTVARGHYRAALTMNEDLGDAHGTGVNLTNLAHAERLAGRPEQACELIRAALAQPYAVADQISYVESSIVLAEVALDLDRATAAAELATTALGHALRLEQASLAARAHLVVARERLEADDVGTAERAARDALEVARRVRVPELAQDAHLALSATALAAGDAAAAWRQAAAAARVAVHLDNPAGSAGAGLSRARILLAQDDPGAALGEAVLAEAAFRSCGHGRGLAEAEEVRDRAGQLAGREAARVS